MTKISEKLRNAELTHIIKVIIIGLTLLDIVVLTSIFFVSVNPETYQYILYFDLAVVIILIIQFVYNLYIAENKSTFIKENWFDILGMVPEILLGGYATFLRYFRLIKILSLFSNNLKHFFN